MMKIIEIAMQFQLYFYIYKNNSKIMLIILIDKNNDKLGQKKKIVMLPSPDQNLKIGSVGRIFFFFFFFFLRTVRELSFPIFFKSF